MAENVLVLADGTKIDKTTGEVLKPETPKTELLNENSQNDDSVDEDEIIEVKARLPVNRHISDLPGDVASTRALAVVAGLSIFGLSDNEIAYICNVEQEKIIAIKQSQRYGELTTGIIDNVMRAQSDNVRAMFVNSSRKAADNIIAGLQSKVPEVRHMASKDVLDRAGFRPADVIEHRIRHENELKIVHIKGDDTSSVVIEADYEEVS